MRIGADHPCLTAAMSAAAGNERRNPMPRYLVERSFPQGLSIPLDDSGRQAVDAVVRQNLEHGVTWVTSYVSPDRTQTYCIYDGPSPQAVRDAAAGNQLPVDKVTPVSVLDPYFYRP
jgi:hypothetical protein